MSHTKMVKGPKAHPHSVWLYWGVFFVLLCLTVFTVYITVYDFGYLNFVVALLVASTKALLVVGIFMHLAYDNKFFGVVAATALVFLGLFILFPLLDVDSRSLVDATDANFLPRDEAVYKYELAHPKALPLRPGLTEPKESELIFTKPGH